MFMNSGLIKDRKCGFFADCGHFSSSRWSRAGKSRCLIAGLIFTVLSVVSANFSSLIHFGFWGGFADRGTTGCLLRTVLRGADDSLQPLTNLVNHVVGPEARPAKANWKAHRDNRQAEVFSKPAGSYALIDRPREADLPVCAGLWPSPAEGQQQTSTAEQPRRINETKPRNTAFYHSRMSNGDLNYTNRECGRERKNRGRND